MAIDFVINSGCCGSSWQLVLGEGDYCLVCGKCGRMIGIAFEVTGPSTDGGTDGFCGDCSKRFNVRAEPYCSDLFPGAD